MGLGQLAKSAIGRLFPRLVLVKGLPSRNPRVALTFDDGPHPVNTSKILDELDRHGARATFFLQGSEARKHPELVRAIHNRGHQIGNHGHSHYDAWRTPRGTYIADICEAQSVLQDIVGCPIDRIFRPPHGRITAPAFLELGRLGYRFIFWSIDSRDSFIRNPAELSAKFCSMHVSDGDVILLHEDYDHTVASLPEILGHIAGKSLAFEPIVKI